jgi:Lrp/AsnC family transcriptional regulator for asnA, asnC and gidA
MSLHFDSTDWKILKYLVRNSREKVVDIASFVGVTSAAIHQRIGKIKKTGVIEDFTLKLNEKKLGYTTCAFIGVFIDRNSQYHEVIEKMKKIPEIVEAYYTTGKYSVFIKLYAKDNDHLMMVLNEKIQHMKGVQRTETFISLETPIDRSIPLK